MRRMGKTSLLREMERRLAQSGHGLPLFWDIQGSFDGAGLGESLRDALEDARHNYPETWRELPAVDPTGMAPHQMIRGLGLVAASLKKPVFLLMDEAEELLNIAGKDPECLVLLRKCLQNHVNLRTVLCSTPRLFLLHRAQSSQTSPFLHGFHLDYLGPFSEEESRLLLAQGEISFTVQEEILLHAEGNPYQTQLMARLCMEGSAVEHVVLELEANPALQQVLDVNYELLGAEDKRLLLEIQLGRNRMERFDPAERSPLKQLQKLGLLQLFDGGLLTVSSHFQRKWLQKKWDEDPSLHAISASDLPVGCDQPIPFLAQAVTLYQMFLQYRMRGVRLVAAESQFALSRFDGRLYVKRALEEPQAVPQEGAWLGAIRDLAAFLKPLTPTVANWCLARFFFLAGTATANENELLDLLSLLEAEYQLGDSA